MRTGTWRHFDFWLLGVVAILIIFGIAMIRSAIAGNIELIEIDALSRHILYAGIGFAVLMLVAAMDYHYWATLGRVLYIGIALFLAAIGIVGEARFGAARWLDVGFALIQPSEPAKITMIVVLADFFARNKEQLHNWLWIGRSALLTLVLVVLILMQPDLSTAIVFMVIWFALLWASGLKLKQLSMLIGAGLILPIVGFPFLEDYQKNRVANFLFPDPSARHGDIYNVEQARITIGSGGLLGHGYNQGPQVQLRFLKVRDTDFIFSAIGEEFGFVGTVILLLLFFFVIWRCLRAAQMAPDTFGALICYGVATLIAFQTVVNVGMNLRLLPVTGLPLPFISRGGSSLLSTMLGIGLVESVVSRHRVT